jgi:hypothetical protein
MEGYMKETKREEEIKRKLIAWCKETKYSQGDDYYARKNPDGTWIVGYSNDYPLQHGPGEKYLMTEEELAKLGI